jgi:type I restriction enzyme R subunit
LDIFQLIERDICTKYVTPALRRAGWQQHEFREEVNLTAGRVMVRGQLAARVRNPEAKGGPKRADYVLYARPSLPIAVLEIKQARFAVGHGMQQALTYAEMIDFPFAISSNGSGFLLHDRTGLTQPTGRDDWKQIYRQFPADFFGGAEQYARAVQALEKALYETPEQKSA